MKKTNPNPPNPGFDHENIFELDTSKAKPEELKRQHWWCYLRHYSFEDKTETKGGCLKWCPQKGLDVLNEQRRPEEFCAFRYEAIRRSLMPDLPIWPLLEYFLRTIYIAALIDKEEISCMFVVGRDANASDPFCFQLPSEIGFDLHASDRTLAAAFLIFVRSERIRRKIEPIKTSRQKRCKPQDYSRLELFDDDVLVKAASAKKGPGRPPQDSPRSPKQPSPDRILKYETLRTEAQQWFDKLRQRPLFFWF